jgi:predicted transcriptional regulator of viral defense system
MRFLELKEKIQDQLIFTTNDIKKFDGSFSIQRLAEWQKKGYIKKIVKGYYILSDYMVREEDLFAFANRIYQPSYVSLESALRYYNFIPEGVFEIISVSTKKTNDITSDVANFHYRAVKPTLFFGYQVLGLGFKKFKIATPEKAIIDYLYLNTNLKRKNDFQSLRINKDLFHEKVKISSLREMLEKVNNKSLEKRLNAFLETMKNA